MRLWVKNSDETGFKFSEFQKMRRGFTLIELLVVVAIISLLLAVLVPIVSSARRKAITLRSMVNQHNIATSLNLFANDNNDWYPLSIASAGNNSYWNWVDPRLIVGYPHSYQPRMYPGGHRSLSGYMYDYIPDPEILHCPASPFIFQSLDQLWQQGDEWDNPNLPQKGEPMTGSYCFWWNYKGWLTDRGKVFTGPRRTSGGTGQSSILVSDYFGSDTWRNWGEYGSCETFLGGAETSSKDVLTDFWRGGSIDEAPPKIKLRAAYTDGHCETNDSSEVITLEVARNKDGTNPFPKEIGKGKFYLPRNAAP